MIPPVLPGRGVLAWIGAWVLDRFLRELEDRATDHVRDEVFTTSCCWCGRTHSEVRHPGDPAPTGAPAGPGWAWLESRRSDGNGPFWCSRRCWEADLAVNASAGFPAGPDWDECLAPDDEL